VTHYRAAARDTAKTAMQLSSAFALFAMESAWAQKIDADLLPVFGVATPREDKRLTGLEESQRVFTLILVLKRLGDDDLEDVLDDDSLEAEVVLLGALAPSVEEVLLQTTEVRIEGEGARRIGTLTMNFQITIGLVDPLA
jgi:hypothetical protein